jgi:DNA-binding SARP family transcriptional activator
MDPRSCHGGGMSQLRIVLLGHFQVWCDDQPLSSAAWPGRKARQLFKILITHRHRVVSGDELVEWLWPHLSPESARNSLWVAVSRLRRLLQPQAADRLAFPLIDTVPPGYRFDPAGRCEIDVDAFEARFREGWSHHQRGDWAAAIGAYTAAEALYAGDYLVEDPYEDWAIPTRERLADAFLDVHEGLAICYLAQGSYDRALDQARQVLARDRGRESAWRLVMEAQYRAGAQDQALRTFEQCRAALASELGVDPLPETVALHERILRAPLPAPRAQPARASQKRSVPMPFVGRDREWALVSSLLQEAMAGRGRVVLVAGEPGIGKTRLLEELAGLATARGARVLAGRCYELEQNMAYAPVIDALRTLLAGTPALLSSCPPAQVAAVAELLPDLRRLRPELPPYQPLPPDEERTRLLAALAHVIQHCTWQEPLVLLLDDLHWADPSTLQFVHYLGRQIHDQPLLLVGAYRSTQVSPGYPLAALRNHLVRQGVLVDLSLPPFGQEDVVLLLRILGHEQVGDALARQLYRETEGHPFFLAEVLQTLVQEGWIVVDGEDRWQLADAGTAALDRRRLLPPGVRAAVLGRLGRLSAEDRAFLDHASVIGREFSLSLMARLVGQPETVLVEQADELSIRGFLRPRGPDCYEFNHDLMRRTAYEALSEPRCRLIHRQVAGALLALQAPAGTVATHYAAGDRPWLALPHALEAAEGAARVTAYDEALAWCQQARAIAEAHPHAVPAGFRTRLHLQWRTLWYYRGDLARTLAADRAALAAARQEGDPAAELQALWHLAHDETQVAAGGPSGLQAEALALAQDLDDPAALARSLARYGSDSGFLATPAGRERALATLDRAVSLARQVGDPALLHHVLCEMWGVGRLPRARAALEEALALVRRLGDRQEEVGTLAKLADLLARQGDFPAAMEYACQGLALAERVDSPAYGAWNRRALGQALVALGQTDEGLAHLRDAAQTFETLAWQAMLAGSLLRLGLALRLAGDGVGATAALERVLALSRETHELYESAYALAVLGELRLAQGEREAGRQALQEAAALAPEIGLPWHRAGTLLHIGAGRLLLGQAEVALAAAEEAICLAEAEDLREVRAQALRLRVQATDQA